jgi:hypothetical protein
VKITRLLFVIGIVLTCGWLYFYAHSTVELTLAALKNEPYYFDVIRFYMLPYAIAPFVAISYIEGTKKSSSNSTLPIKQWISFISLTFFALLQLFESLVFFFAFFSTFTAFEFSLEWFSLMLPFVFLIFFLLLIRFLFQTRHSLKSSIAM